MSARISGLRPGIAVVALCWMGVTGGCATATTGSFADEKTDFSVFRTFSWINTEPYIESDSSGVLSASARSSIETGIREQLENAGYAYTPNRDDADILVAFTVGTREKIAMDAYPVGYRGHWGWHEPYDHYFFRNVSVENYTHGTLGVDIFDNETGRPVWHGWAQKTVTQRDRKDPGSTIKEEIARLFASFPD